MKLIFLFSILAMLGSSSYAKKSKHMPVRYLNKIYGQIHQNASRFSRVVSTFECGQPFKVASGDDRGFTKVIYASYEGFILTNHLSKSRPKDCWQDEYRKYFDFMNLGISEMHHWGRLQDLFLEGEVMP
ncbi:hypothetical protein [Bacteriovorax sp. DB6_IX]|uniref:hypothetical protein n=1 Tax=Bacteriovorax sp. DB6_IX TaxID=1353530 RepID=UPI0012F819B8|nr:hypothetical protein [Bacteriovorax sp. DB6_IX]